MARIAAELPVQSAAKLPALFAAKLPAQSAAKLPAQIAAKLPAQSAIRHDACRIIALRARMTVDYCVIDKAGTTPPRVSFTSYLPMVRLELP